jgi:hypothetical protein
MESQSAYSPVTGSDTFVDVTNPGTRRFMSGLIVTFSPEPIPGLELGAARFFHQAWSGQIDSKLLRTPFEGILKSSVPTGLAIPGFDDKDVLKNQLASVFGRWVLPHSGFEMYAEYGHEDHNADTRDFELEPDHSRIAMVGFKKVFVRRDSSFSAVRAEYIDGSDPTLGRNRGEGGVYVHSVIRQGHTENGQLLGADIGVGSPSGASITWDTYAPRGRSTWYLLRTTQDNSTGVTPLGTPSPGATRLLITIGYDRLSFKTRTDMTYGAALTEAKRAQGFPRQVNVSIHTAFGVRFLQ